VDEVRRITNMSTGQLGLQLTKQLVLAGFRVICFRGVDAPVQEEAFLQAVAGHEELLKMLPFRTNCDLKKGLKAVAEQTPVDAVFHAAALCDFSVVQVTDEHGQELNLTKLSSRTGDVVIRLKPTEKVIQFLRGWFPKSRLVGWKFELDGSREDVIAKGRAQIEESQTDACVLNGRAYGHGFGFYQAGLGVTECASGEELALVLTEWLGSD
jgi:phosphopantothenoylcysteine decarboxylase/phosphopantothenate--cysteine ligase